MHGASLSVITLLMATPGYAQASDDNLETVVVTGTLLKGINPVGTNLVTVNAADIAASGAVNVGAVLENVPQIGSMFNQQPTSSGDSFTHPTLRNLNGAKGQDTLLLVNGVLPVGIGRATTSDGTQIPAMMLERVDVIADGGSAIYGSNAVAGIINFITRKNFEGLEARTSYGTTGNYDAFSLGVLGGHAWNSGNAMLSYEYRNNSNQFVRDRPYGSVNLIPFGGNQDTRSTSCELANITAGGVAYTLTSNTVPNTPGAVKAAAVLGTTKCDNGVLYTTSFPADTQHTFFGTFNQHIADGVDFSMTANWMTHTASSTVSPNAQPSATITNANPFFQSINGETQQTVQYNYAPVMGRVQVTNLLDSSYQVTPVLDIKLQGDWDLKLTANYGRSNTAYITPGLNGVAATNALAATTTATAIDPYNLSLTNQSVIYQTNLYYTALPRDIQELDQIRADVSGSLFSLPGGDVKLAVGTQYEYDHYYGWYIQGPDGQVSPNSAPVSGGLSTFVNVHHYVQSAFGELYVPVVGPDMNIPFVRSLNADVSGRWDRYSDVGSTTNPKIGVTYEPFDGLSIRGNIGKSFNAPSLADTYGAIDTRVSAQSTSGTRVPLSISGKTAAQDAIDQRRPSFQIAGGNNNLVPQTASTFSFGFDYHPDFLEGLDVSLTRWHVTVYHVINTSPYNNASILYSSPAYSVFYILNPTQAQVEAKIAGISRVGFTSLDPYFVGVPANSLPYSVIDARRFNLGNQLEEGYDFQVRYRQQTDWGSLNFGISGSDYTKIVVTAYQNAGPDVDLLATNQSPYYFNAFIGADWGPLSARMSANYSASYTTSAIQLQTHVSSYMPVNMSLHYDLDGMFEGSEGATAGLVINNLFDTNPPFLNSGSGTANGTTLGRYFQFSLSKKF